MRDNETIKINNESKIFVLPINSPVCRRFINPDDDSCCLRDWTAFGWRHFCINIFNNSNTTRLEKVNREFASDSSLCGVKIKQKTTERRTLMWLIRFQLFFFLLTLRQTQRRLSLCINEHLMELSLLRHLRRFWEETKDKGGFDQKTQSIKQPGTIFVVYFKTEIKQ